MKNTHQPAPPARTFVDPQHPPLVLELIKALDWFEESLRSMQEARGMQSVTRPQAQLLAHVAMGERRAARIARKLGLTRQTIASVINELVELGILTVERDPQDARAQLVDFSVEHARQGPQLLALFKEVEDHVATVIGADRLAVVRHALSMDWGTYDR
jgi:DNA-binding MarR family transcriptional regulator